MAHTLVSPNNGLLSSYFDCSHKHGCSGNYLEVAVKNSRNEKTSRQGSFEEVALVRINSICGAISVSYGNPLFRTPLHVRGIQDWAHIMMLANELPILASHFWGS
jgi:hypothetical protein